MTTNDTTTQAPADAAEVAKAQAEAAQALVAAQDETLARVDAETAEGATVTPIASASSSRASRAAAKTALDAALAKVGDAPKGKTAAATFAAQTKAAQAKIRKAAAEALVSGSAKTAASAWLAALADVPAPETTSTSTRTRKPAEPKAEPKFRGVVLDGYAIVKTTPGFDQLLSDGANESAPKWLTRCNLHGKTTAADNRKAGRGLGSADQRAQWCASCKTAAAKASATASE
jgi:hypothetical protein